MSNHLSNCPVCGKKIERRLKALIPIYMKANPKATIEEAIKAIKPILQFKN